MPAGDRKTEAGVSDEAHLFFDDTLDRAKSPADREVIRPRALGLF
jgi:hypothetical protein